MGVSVQGETGRKVAQHAGQGLDIHTAFDTSRGVGVTQIMKPGILAAHPFNDAFVTVMKNPKSGSTAIAHTGAASTSAIGTVIRDTGSVRIPVIAPVPSHTMN